MSGWLRTAFTGRDNQSVDIVRVLAPVPVLALVALQAWAIYRGQAFDAGSFGAASVAVFVGIGGALGMKGHTEPEVK